MLASILSTYLSLNLLVAIAWAVLALANQILARTGRPLRYAAWLRLHYFTLPFVLACTLATPLFPGENFLPAARVWSAPSIQSFSQAYTRSGGEGFLSLPGAPHLGAVEAHTAGWLVSSLAVMLVLAFLFRMIRDFRSLARIRRRSFVVKKLSGISITANDEIMVPFTYWVPGNLTLVLPTHLLGSPADCKIAIAHELQHHRQGDTRWIYALWLLRNACVLNPGAHLWARWVTETQEFACDETLVDHKKVDSKAYARCLVTVAQTASRQSFIPACATGLIFLAERNLLKRRIESMSNVNKPRTKSTVIALAATLVAVIASSAYAAKGLVQDRRVTLAQAQQMQINAQKSSTFPVVVNEAVVRQLNRYLGTPEGRAFIRASLQRMEHYRALVSNTIGGYRAPMELLAMPLLESGYQNLEQKKDGANRSAGLWQFIPETARLYGMRVDEEVDERLNETLETDAGVRYLSALNLRFKDWQLAIMGYNMGENAVQRGIEATGSRDAWTLIERGYEGDQNYLARFMAALLILKNPEMVK